MSRGTKPKTLEVHLYRYMLKFSTNRFKNDYYMVIMKRHDLDHFLFIHIKTENGKKRADVKEIDYSKVIAKRFIDIYEMMTIYPESIYQALTGEKIKVKKIIIKDYRTKHEKDYHLLDYQLRLLLK